MQYNSIIENYFVREYSDKYEEFLLKPKNDFVFKKIFGDAKNKDLLISLLNSTLSDTVNDVTILNSELIKENIQDKKSALDVRAITDAVMEIHFIELSKLKDINNMDKLSQWMSFIKGDSKEVILEMAKVNSDIEKAYDILRTMSQDREARALYLSREMALHDEVTRREEALEEGKVTLLIEQLNKKFKGLSSDLEEKIKKLPEDKFKTLSLEFFELNSIEDIYKYL